MLLKLLVLDSISIISVYESKIYAVLKMTEFERELVKSFNIFFSENGIKGIAFRLKQHRFSHQYLDIVVDSLHPDYCLG